MVNFNKDKDYSFESDVRRLSKMALPYYIGFIYLFICFNLYNIVIAYAMFGFTLLVFLDEEEQFEAQLNRYADQLQNPYITDFTLINLSDMAYYLESVTLYSVFSHNNTKFEKYFINLDLFCDLTFIKLYNVKNLLLSDFSNPSLSNLSFSKSELIKKDDSIEKATFIRLTKESELKVKLKKMKKKLLLAVDPKKKVKIKKQIKQILELASMLEEDLLLHQVSCEFHNTLLFGLYLKSGLYSISEFEYEKILAGSPRNIVYFEYFMFFSYKTDFMILKKNNSDCYSEFKYLKNNNF